jgi:hypothetical protein
MFGVFIAASPASDFFRSTHVVVDLVRAVYTGAAATGFTNKNATDIQNTSVAFCFFCEDAIRMPATSLAAAVREAAAAAGIPVSAAPAIVPR